MSPDTDDKTIFDYDNYRDYLKDTYESLKERRSTFSYRSFARRAGVGSPGLLKMVTDGERNLSPLTTEKFIRGLSLAGLEAEYFRLLVRLNQTPSEKKRLPLRRNMEELLERRKTRSLAKLKEEYFLNWHLPAIREAIPCAGFANDPEKISRFLLDEMTPHQVQQALQLLVRLGLVKTGRNGRLYLTNLHLKADDDLNPQVLRNYHRQIMEEAKKSVERSKPGERELQSLIVAIDSEKIPQAKEKIRCFVEEMREFLSGSRVNQVYQLSLQFYNVTKGEFPT